MIGAPVTVRAGPARAHAADPHPATFHHRLLFDEVGRFDPSFRIAGGYNRLLRKLREAEPHCLGEVIVTGMQIGGSSTSPEHRPILLDEIRAGQIRAMKPGRVAILPPRISDFSRVFQPAAAWTLAAGMVSRMDVSARGPSFGETVWVTDAGPERLTRLERRLFER